MFQDPTMTIKGLNQLLAELESHCPKQAILTFLGSDGQPFVINLYRQGNQVQYGEEPYSQELFLRQIQIQCDPVASIILRSFTPEIDPMTQLPIKELRGYVLQRQGNLLEFEKISPETMFACQNTDAQTGEPLALEQSVRYC
jgi:hypothetical protein